MIHRSGSKAGFGTCALVFFAGIAGNNVLPLRAGDVMRAFSYPGHLDASPAFLLGTIVLERALDLLAVLTLAVIVTFAADVALPYPGLLRIVAFLLVLGVFAIVAVLTFAATIERWALRLCSMIFSSPKLRERVSCHIRSFLEIFAQTGPAAIARLSALSLGAWVFEGTVFVSIAAALDLRLPLVAPWIAFVLATFVAMVPSAPGYVGTFDMAVMAALVSSGTSTDSAAAFALLVHATLWVSVTLAGAISFFILQRIPPKNKLSPPTVAFTEVRE